MEHGMESEKGTRCLKFKYCLRVENRFLHTIVRFPIPLLRLRFRRRDGALFVLFAGLLLGGVKYGLVPQDPMLLFVLLIESCMPSAQNSVIMLQVRIFPLAFRLRSPWIVCTTAFASGQRVAPFGGK